APTRTARRRAGRTRRGAPRSRRGRTARDGDESVRARLPAALAARVVVAAATTREPAVGAGGRAAGRSRRPGAPPLVVRRQVRARLGCPLVRRLALRARLRTGGGLRDRARLGRGSGTARRAYRWAVRPVPGGSRTAAARPGSRDGSPPRPGATAQTGRKRGRIRAAAACVTRLRCDGSRGRSAGC